MNQREARERARAAEKAALVADVQPALPSPASRPGLPAKIKQGYRAHPEVVDSKFKEACDGGLSAAKIIAMNPPIGAVIAERRDDLCRCCNHSTRFSTGAILCEAVECPRWRWLDRREINKHQGGLCPIGAW